MATSKRKIWVSRHITPLALDDNAQFDVEAKEDGSWTQVGGPFPDRPSANTFAQQFSQDNPGVETRVVVDQ